MPDGTWCCALAEDGANYTVVGITKYGSVSIASNNYVRANAPWFDEDGVRIADSGDGTYSISFTLRDDRYDLKKTPPEITLTLDEAYASLLGTDSFTFTPVYGYDGSYTYGSLLHRSFCHSDRKQRNRKKIISSAENTTARAAFPYRSPSKAAMLSRPGVSAILRFTRR